jgi:DHA1 family tetracycline resistance protein-like MFS transporter
MAESDHPTIGITTHRRQAALAFIYVTIVLDMLAMGLVMPVLPKLVLTFLNGDAVRAAHVFGLFGTAWALMQFISSPLMGVAADRFGRRPIILVSNFGLGLDYILMALAPGIQLLFVGRVVSGITAASIGASGAFIADITPAERRAAAFGMMNVFFGIGFVFGPALGGLLGAISPRLPFWVAAGLSLLNGLYGLLILPESLPPERRAPFSWRRASPIGSFRLLRQRSELFGLATAGFIVQFAHSSLPNIFVLYATYRYNWDTQSVGLSFAAIGICSAIVGGALVRLVVARLGERLTMLCGFGAGIAGFAMLGLAPTSAWFLVGIPVLSLWGLAGPALNGLMTRYVLPSEQGQLQSAVSSLAAMAGLVAPSVYTASFAFAITLHGFWHQPGAPFLVAASCMCLAVFIGWQVTRGNIGPGSAQIEPAR